LARRRLIPFLLLVAKIRSQLLGRHLMTHEVLMSGGKYATIGSGSINTAD
jgi:hypothetical protein